ncbi:leucine rich repeat domain protein [Dictyocaulus viviparus]|uniref:Leucine rich repeat domain protein n=1 Tax=Dictyocaulus viviparus TaxID=29172 RepID=A0A0D8XA96_DICVI|nr:leucine rich repeat domain protein [Dictyocaulus viviparus]
MSYLLLSVLLYSNLIEALMCPIRCTCTMNIVQCTGVNLTRIPENIPTGTHRLDLQENQIEVIRRHEIRHLKQLKILWVYGFKFKWSTITFTRLKKVHSTNLNLLNDCELSRNSKNDSVLIVFQSI